ncbi:hypothetical protein OH77DRAFT_1432221 [Trametes cingulata]|nr:hypothetical protein OH77DRAFT_1432221 [Trametes cingulata]
MLYAPIQDGGLGLLNLKARNEAIELVWLKEYLNLSATRPRWAVLADALLARAVSASSRNVDVDARFNVFMQTWKVSTRGEAGL